MRSGGSRKSGSSNAAAKAKPKATKYNNSVFGDIKKIGRAYGVDPTTASKSGSEVQKSASNR